MSASRDLIAAFVLEGAPEQFCAACLAFHAEVSLEESRAIVADLTKGDGFAFTAGECDGCGRRVPVLSAKP